jgi:hypothetical protein
MKKTEGQKSLATVPLRAHTQVGVLYKWSTQYDLYGYARVPHCGAKIFSSIQTAELRLCLEHLQYQRIFFRHIRLKCSYSYTTLAWDNAFFSFD